MSGHVVMMKLPISSCPQLSPLHHLNNFRGGMFKLNAKSDANFLLYSLSNLKWDSHTVHMLTQLRLPPPLTSSVKSSLFTHVHSSPLSLVATLHRHCANGSHYINNGWTFSRQSIHTCTHIPVHFPWLPGYINVIKTILVILTMVGLFPDRPYICFI